MKASTKKGQPSENEYAPTMEIGARPSSKQ